MNKKRIIRKIAFGALWVLVIGGMATLLIAANRKESVKRCQKILISIHGASPELFVEEADILEQMEKIAGFAIVNRPVEDIILHKVEKGLERNQWILDAELYFDREQLLHVLVNERVPIARLITASGQSFYMDSSGHRMPLLEGKTIRVTPVTGYMVKRKMNAEDSADLKALKELTLAIYQDSFWVAQTGQVDISTDGKFEITPLIGDHVLRLGKGGDIRKKLRRAQVFYEKVMSKAGFTKYSAIDVQYEGQVVGIHRGPQSPVDSIQLAKNIEDLLKYSTIENVRAEMLPDSGRVVNVRNN